MKKLICLLLCVCLACPLGLSSVFAAQTQTTTEVFAYDFEADLAAGSIESAKDTVGRWTSLVRNAEVLIAPAEDAVQGGVACYSTEDTNSRGPRMEKVLYFDEQPTQMTVSFKYKREGGSLSFGFLYADGSAQNFTSCTSSAWAESTTVLDFENGTYVSYMDGEVSKQGTIVNGGTSTLTLRFSAGVSQNRRVYVDDVSVVLSGTHDIEHINDAYIGLRTPEEIMAPYASCPAAPVYTVPTGAYSLFAYDGALNSDNGVMTGSEASWSGKKNAAAAVVGEDKAIRLTNDYRTAMDAYLCKSLFVGQSKPTLTVEYAAFLSDSKTYVELIGTDNRTLYSSLKDYAIGAQTTGAVADAWNKIKAVFDIEAGTASMYVNDTPVVEDVAFALAFPDEAYECQPFVRGTLSNADTMLVDSVLMYQDTEAIVEGVKYYGTTGTNWSLVGTEVTEDSYINNLRAHPRLIINDLAGIREKVVNDPQSAAWYEDIKADADKLLVKDDDGNYTVPVVVYKYGNGRNIGGVAGTIQTRLWALGFAYMIENDEAYVERGLAEIRNAGTFPDWSNVAPILPAELMFGIACFYDWCYHSPTLTADIKQEIIQIVFDKALWQYARSYDGVISVEIAGGTSNRTIVANACGAGMAIAMADEYPEIAQFIFDGAVEYTKPAVDVYGSDGAFPEGTSYWEYASRTLFTLITEIEAAVVDGYTLPEEAQWYFDNEAIRNTVNYYAYMSGPAGNFDYGDSGVTCGTPPLIFWAAQEYDNPFYAWYLNHVSRKRNHVMSRKHYAINYRDPNYDAHDNNQPLDRTFNAEDTAQVASMRSSWTGDDALFVAIQGGSNTTGHMFRSLGTFVLDANGERFIRTIGHSDYSRLYDDNMYYGIRAEGQNTIVLNPGTELEQPSTAVARFTRHAEAENEAFTVLDMSETSIYLDTAQRGVYMTPGRSSVVMQDELTTTEPSELWWFAHTDARIYLLEEGKGALLRVGTESMYVRITDGPADAVFTVMDALPLPTSPVAPDDTYQDCQKLAIHLTDVTELSLTVEFVPLKKGEGIPTSFTVVKPIADWTVSDNTISVNRMAGDALVMADGSPNAFVYEEKVLLDETDNAVVPYTDENGVVYVPAEFVAAGVFGQAKYENEALTVTRGIYSGTITEDLIWNNDVLYAPATALATALGLHLYTDEDGIIAFSERALAYTAAEKAAVADALYTRVLLDGMDFAAFTPDKTHYYVGALGRNPRVRVPGADVTQTEASASFTRNGTTYTLQFVEDIDAQSVTNIALGKVPTADIALGTSNLPEYMTDGSRGTVGAVKSYSATEVTFEIELGGTFTVESFDMYDRITSAGSVMEQAVYSGRLEDGTWIEMGTADLTTGTLQPNSRRATSIESTSTQPVTAIRIHMSNVDDYINMLYIYEIEIYGTPVYRTPTTPATYTSYALDEAALSVTTEVVCLPQSGYLVATALKGDKQVGLRILPLTESTIYEYSLPCTDFDTVKVVLLDSFLTLRVLSEAEVLD